MEKLFKEVLRLDEKINEAYESGNYEQERILCEQQDEIVNEINEKGLRGEFDKYITNTDKAYR